MKAGKISLKSKVWSHAAFRAVSNTSFEIDDLPFRPGQRATVRRTLREMEQLGWLVRESNQDSVWHAGPTTAGFTSKQPTGAVGECVKHTPESNPLNSCPNCGKQLSSEDRDEGPEHPEIGWEYYECPRCEETIRADTVEGG